MRKCEFCKKTFDYDDNGTYSIVKDYVDGEPNYICELCNFKHPGIQSLFMDIIVNFIIMGLIHASIPEYYNPFRDIDQFRRTIGIGMLVSVIRFVCSSVWNFILIK